MTPFSANKLSELALPIDRAALQDHLKADLREAERIAPIADEVIAGASR